MISRGPSSSPKIRITCGPAGTGAIGGMAAAGGTGGTGGVERPRPAEELEWPAAPQQATRATPPQIQPGRLRATEARPAHLPAPPSLARSKAVKESIAGPYPPQPAHFRPFPRRATLRASVRWPELRTPRIHPFEPRYPRQSAQRYWPADPADGRRPPTGRLAHPRRAGKQRRMSGAVPPGSGRSPH